MLDWMADNLALIMFVSMFFVIFSAIRRLRHGRDGVHFRVARLVARAYSISSACPTSCCA